jgi:hypothetical protein
MSADDALDGADLVDELERIDALRDRNELELIGLRRLQHAALRDSLKRMGFNVDGFEQPSYPTPAERRARETARWNRIPLHDRKVALIERGILSPRRGGPLFRFSQGAEKGGRRAAVAHPHSDSQAAGETLAATR